VKIVLIKGVEVPLERVIFLDRDGVINRDSPDYIKSWSEFEFLPGSIEAIRQLTRQGYHLIVITNQAIVNRGLATLDDLHDIHERLRSAVLKTGGLIHDIQFCPHRPEENCDCRKPKPGMILQAQKRHAIDLARTTMIGDNAKDILCGRAAGCGATVLVRTGNGEQALRDLTARNIAPDLVAADLLDAAAMIIDQRIPHGGSH
jgi:D-glycero-D-manno-heptose 1,7-bisphosphate phosphatase